MSIVDLAKARAYAEFLESIDLARDAGQHGAADWIISLADEVESLQRGIESARRSEQAALADAAKASEERDQVLAALTDILGTISKILPSAT